MTTMRLAICGPGRSGKGVASNWLSQHTNLRYTQSTSQAAAELCYRALKDEYGYTSVADAWAKRHQYRGAWAETIWQYNEPDGTRLYEEMLGENDILDGIRRARELFACHAKGLIDLSIWIDRPDTVEGTGSMTIRKEHCDIIVPNYDDDASMFPKFFFEKLEHLTKALGIYNG